MMFSLSKKINIIGFSIIALWCEVIGIVFFFDLEIANDDYELMYLFFKNLSLPLSGILFLLVSISKSNNAVDILAKFFLIFVLGFVGMLLPFLDGMCTTSINEVLYINKSYPQTIIAKRSFGCGATDSSLPLITIEKIEPFTPFFIRATVCDTSQIKLEEWIRK